MTPLGVKLEPSVRCFLTVRRVGSARPASAGLVQPGCGWASRFGFVGVVVNLGIGRPRCRFIIRPAPIAKLPRFRRFSGRSCGTLGVCVACIFERTPSPSRAF